MASFSITAILGIISIVFTTAVFHPTNAQTIATPCTGSMMTTFTPCLNYVTGSSSRGSSPTEDCCNAVKSLISDGMDCMCLIVTGNVPISIPFLNRNLAISLPRMCRTSVPVQCKASGDPLPSPGPALFGPSPAPGAPPRGPGPEAEAPVDGEGLGVAPEASEPPPAEVWLGPSQNPGIRPVLNPNSGPISGPILTSSNIVTMSLGIIAFHFF